MNDMPTTPQATEVKAEGGHTPGPWTVFPREGAIEGFTVETTPEQLPVAVVPKNRRPNSVAEANARLIAAAPNMLVLLLAASEFYNEGRVWTPEFAERVDAAIAKATGAAS